MDLNPQDPEDEGSILREIEQHLSQTTSTHAESTPPANVAPYFKTPDESPGSTSSESPNVLPTQLTKASVDILKRDLLKRILEMGGKFKYEEKKGLILDKAVEEYKGLSDGRRLRYWKKGM